MHKVPRLYNTFHPTTYDLHLDLDRINRKFSGTVTISGDKVSADPLTLHAKDLNISSVTLPDGTKVETENSDYDQLVLLAELPAGTISFSISFDGAVTDGMHGLYPCYFDIDGEKHELLATQFESHHAREVFPCIDEPEAKATFNLTLVTETGVEVLSNMPIKSQAVDTKLTTTFDSTPRMSTYLLAFVVGDLQKQTATTESGVEVNIWATRAQAAESLIFPLEVAVGTIEFFDDYFGTAYPLPKVDHVALPDFSSGAMENWGLITYREIALLVDNTSSVSMREYVATVIAHETSHQWFGNLVTMKWWDDLWLNESFATIMEYVAVDALYPEWQTWNTFASQETLSALRRDQLAGVQAVKCEVNHPDEISTLFDPSIVYAKGGRLLKMLMSYIGEDAFRQGLREYFKTHAYKNTVGADLWKAFSSSSGKNIEEFMNTWISQSGFPIVNIRKADEGYTLTQERFVIGEEPNQSSWPIPLFAESPDFPDLLSTKTYSFQATQGSPLLNIHNDAHFVTQYDDEGWGYIVDALKNGRLDALLRLSLLHETSLLARGGKTSTSKLIPLLLAYRNETSEPVWNIISMVIGDLRRFIEEDETSETHLKEIVQNIAFPLYGKLGFLADPSEPEQDTKLRATILSLLSFSDHQPVIDMCLDAFRSEPNAQRLPSEIRGVILAVAAKHGTAEDFDRLLSIHTTTTNAELRDDVTSGLCTTKNQEQIQTLLARLKGDDIKKQDLFKWFIYLLRNRYARDQAWEWMTTNWTWIEESFKGDKSYDDFARYSASVFSTRQWLNAYEEFFGPMKNQTALKRAIEIGLTEIESRVEWLERDQESVRTTLARENE